MGDELKRIEAWTGAQATNYDAQPCEDGPFYYADAVDAEIAEGGGDGR